LAERPNRGSGAPPRGFNATSNLLSSWLSRLADGATALRRYDWGVVAPQNPSLPSDDSRRLRPGGTVHAPTTRQALPGSRRDSARRRDDHARGRQLLPIALHPPGRASGEGDAGERIRHGRSVRTGPSRSASWGAALCRRRDCRFETRDSGRDTPHRRRADRHGTAADWREPRRRTPSAAFADGPAPRCARARVLNGFLFLRGEDLSARAQCCAPEIADAKLATSSERFAALHARGRDLACAAHEGLPSLLCRTGSAGASGFAWSHHHHGAEAPHRPLPATTTMTSAKVETHGACGLNEPIGADKPRVRDTASGRRGRRLGGRR